MDTLDVQDFDDELQHIEEALNESEMRLDDKSFDVPIKTLNLREPITVEVGTDIEQCIKVMVESGIGCLLIVEQGKLKGIFTERDVLTKITPSQKNVAELVVDDFMTADPKALNVEDTLFRSLQLMDRGGYRHVPVVDGDQRPVAVVSVKDILAYMVEFFPQDVLNLPPHPIRVGTRDREGG